jgi:hypothetical protein
VEAVDPLDLLLCCFPLLNRRWRRMILSWGSTVARESSTLTCAAQGGPSDFADAVLVEGGWFASTTKRPR